MDPAYDMQSHEKQVLVNDSLIPEDNAQNPSLPSRGSSNSTITQSSSSSSEVKPILKKKRTRISKACEYCRKKKVKCNGCQPCLNCLQSNNGDCEYAVNDEKKPKILKKKKSTSLKSKLNKDRQNKALDERLSKIEGILAELVAGIGTNDNTSTSKPVSRLNVPNGKEAKTDESSPLQSPKEIKEESANGHDEKHDPKVESNFHGSHSVINIFSKKSVEWLLRPVLNKCNQDIEVFKDIAIVHDFYTQAFLDTISQPIKARINRRNDLMDNTFANATIPLEILSCYDDIFLVSYVCKGDHIRKLFQTYFEEPDQNGSRRRSFLWSELLLMTAAIGICISVLIDDRNNTKDTDKPKYPCSLSSQQLIEINFKCFYSMIFYHRRLCVISEGFPTVTAFVLLIMYFDFAVPILHVTFLAVSTVMHYARQLGLHKSETYREMGLEEQRTRRILWWFCEYLHIEYCFQKGYDLDIGDQDMTSFSGDDASTKALIKSNWNLIQSTKNSDTPIDALTTNQIKETKANHICASYTMHSLSKIRVKSYQLLYSSKAQKKNLSTILTSVDELNSEMKDLCSDLPGPMAILFYDEPGFLSNSAINSEILLNLDNGYENTLLIQFEYFSHLLTINRLLLQEFPQDMDNKFLTRRCLHHKNIANRSARTILYIARNLAEKKVNFILINWFSYSIFAAFAHLGSMCLEDPQSPEAISDIDLLIDISYSFLAFENQSFKVSRFSLKRYVYDIYTRCILKLYLKVANEETRNMFHEKYKNLHNHLRLEETFHEFFVNEKLGFDPSKTYQALNKLFRPFWINSNERLNCTQVNAADDAASNQTSSTPLESLSSSSGILYGNSSSSSTSFQPPMVHQRNSVSSHQFDYTQDFPHNGGKPLEISYLVHPQMKHFDAAIDSATKRSGSSNDKELPETFDLLAISAINAAQMQQRQQQQPPFFTPPPHPPLPEQRDQQPLLLSQYQQQPEQQPEQQQQPRSNRFNSNFTSFEEMIEENYAGDLNFPNMFYN